MDQQHPYLNPQDFQYNQQAQWQQQNQQPMSGLQHPQPQQGQGPPPIVTSPTPDLNAMYSKNAQPVGSTSKCAFVDTYHNSMFSQNRPPLLPHEQQQVPAQPPQPILQQPGQQGFAQHPSASSGSVQTPWEPPRFFNSPGRFLTSPEQIVPSPQQAPPGLVQPSQQAQFSTPVNAGGAAGQFVNPSQQHSLHTASPVPQHSMQAGPFGAQQMPYDLPHASSSHPGGLDSHPMQPAPPQSVPPVFQQPIHVDPRSASAAPGWLDVPAWALGNRTPVNNASQFTSNAQAVGASVQQSEASRMREAERRERINALEEENSQRELDIVIEASKYGMEPFEVKSEEELEREIAATHRDWLEIRKKQLQEEHEQRMQELAARSNFGNHNGQGGGSHRGAGPASQWSKHSSSASHRASSKSSHKSVAPASASRVSRTPSVQRGLPRPAEGNLADQEDVGIVHEKLPAARAVDIERSNSPRQSRSHSRRHTRQREAASTSRVEVAREIGSSKRRDRGGRYRSAGVEVYYASGQNTDGYMDPGKIRSKRWSFSKR